MSIYHNSKKPVAGLAGQYQQLAHEAAGAVDGQFFTSSEASRVIAMESFDVGTPQGAELSHKIESLRVTLAHVFSQHGQAGAAMESLEGQARQESSTIAAIVGSQLAANPRAHFATSLERRPQDPFTHFIAPQGGQTRTPAMEAYDESENRETVIYSALYNANAPKQDAFAEAFFPTVTVTPDQFGFTISLRLINVQNDWKHKLDGELSRNFDRKNIVHALIDPEILKSEITKIIPVLRDENKTKFVDQVLVPPKNIVFEGEQITTSWLKVGERGNLVSLGTTDALLATGLLSTSDNLDPSIQLESILMQISADEVIEFPKLSEMPAANLVAASQGNYRVMNLQLDSHNFRVNKLTKKLDGSASTVLAPIVAAEAEVRLSVSMFGNVNIETGDYNFNTGAVEVYDIRDKDGNLLDLTQGTGKTLADLFNNAKVIGNEVKARRTNSNFRQRGQMLDLTRVNLVYGVPLLSPITVARTLTSGDQNDAADLAALVTATNIRTTNDAIAKVLDVVGFLERYVAVNGRVVTEDSEMLGAGRFLVSPYFKRYELDMLKAVDSLTSADRAADTQAALVNQVRDAAYNMYRDSGYKAAADMMAGGVAGKPTVICGTDPVIAAYLQVVGDTRTLGNEFDIKVVSTLNITMKGKIVLGFGQFDSGLGTPNPLHFGNMAWKPEITAILPLHRGGQNSKEVIVQPSYLHVANCPVAALIEVTNIDKVVASKVEIFTAPKDRP